MIKRKKRKKRRRFKEGLYTSIKNGETYKYRSSWELAYMKYLDENPDVIEFKYEFLKVPYVSNIKTKKIRNYYPDFYIVYSDKTIIVEIKPSAYLNRRINIKKFDAINTFCLTNNFKFELVTEVELKKLQLI